jgi:arylsulfatase A-like enzyme
MTIHLVDLVGEAKLTMPSPNHIDIQRITIQKDSRTVIFQHPDSSIIFPKLRLGEKPSMSFSIGINPVVHDKLEEAVQFKIYLKTGLHRKCIFSGNLHPRMVTADQGWHDHVIDLSPWAGKEVRFHFKTSAKIHRYAWSCWGNPKIEHQKTAVRKITRNKNHRHVFLITSDAFSKRFLGCYGHPFMQTPSINRLAEQGLQFQEAYSVSSITMGAYASMLTGRLPTSHGIVKEWGTLAPDTPTHLDTFKQQGYATAFFSGETEIGLDASGFTRRFDQSVANICNPAQDGSVTLRSFERWLNHQEDRPLFCWLQFFDTHPPSLAPVPYNRLYNGKSFYPAFSSRKWRIFGLEGLVELEKELPNLEKGLEAPLLIRRLYGCARALRDNRQSGPDIMQHIRRLPSHVRRGLGFQEFGLWLESELVPVSQGEKASPDLLDWLHLLRKEIQFINDNITSWLTETTDFNDAVVQYAGCTSYFDHLIGGLTEILHQQGIYDQSCIILTSPHGEIMEYDGVFFHHHLPHFDVYDIPLIIKLPHQNQGRSVNGIIQLNDILPTVAGLLDLPVSGSGSGGIDQSADSRQGHLQVRSYATAYDLHDLTRSVIQNPYLFVRFRENYRITSGWAGKEGDEFLFKRDVDGGMIRVDDTQKFREMRRLAESSPSQVDQGK